MERFNNPYDSEIAFAIFNRSYEHFSVDPASGLSVVSIEHGARFMTRGKNQLINFANRMKRRVSINTNLLMPGLKRQGKAALDLIGLIQKEYGSGNE